MDRLDYYFRQLVTEGELDLGFDQVQERIEQAAVDTAFDGFATGGLPFESAPAALTYEMPNGGVGYSPEGKRIEWPTTETVDLSQDDLGAPTAIANTPRTFVTTMRPALSARCQPTRTPLRWNLVSLDLSPLRQRPRWKPPRSRSSPQPCRPASCPRTASS